MATALLTPVRVATLTHTTLTATASRVIDGVTLVTDDRVLVKSQDNNNLTQNGIYVLQADGSLTRTVTAGDLISGATQATMESCIVFVKEGTTFADTGWILSNNGNFTVGTSELTFKRFTVNEKESNSVSSTIVYRVEKGIPLTNQELDNNFKYLASEIDARVRTIDYDATDIRDKLSSLSSEQLNFDAFKLQGKFPSTATAINTVVVRDASGDIFTNNFRGNLVGNADTATLATTATIANSLGNYVVPISKGGTGANSSTDALTNLGALPKAGGTMTGKLTLLAATGGSPGIASFNMAPGAAPTSPSEGDVWSTIAGIFYKLNNSVEAVAKLNSPAFIGAPTAPTASIPALASDPGNTGIATTAFVQGVRLVLKNDIDTKAPINNPDLTGTPLTSAIAGIDDTSRRIATTAFVQAVRSDLGNSIALKAPINSPDLTGTPLASTITGTADDSRRISTTAFVQAVRTLLQNDINTRALSSNVYTKTQIDTTFSGYSTTSQMNTAISNTYATKAYVDGLQPLWGTSKKFVQSSDPAASASNGDFWFKI